MTNAAAQDDAEDKPLAPWGIYAVVTEGTTTYEGEKLRAVLSYGEIGGPELVIEQIDVEIGFPSPSRVLWRTDVDLYGEFDDPCPIAEMYCARVDAIRWASGKLSYSVIGPDFRFRCTISGIPAHESITSCFLDYPADIEAFIDRREICDHFRGEDAYDAERGRFLAQQTEESCTGTDSELVRLKDKYKNDNAIMQLLERFEIDVEANDSEEHE